MGKNLTIRCSVIGIATALLSGCSATSGLFKSSDEKIAEACAPYVRAVTIEKANQDYQQVINNYHAAPAECKTPEGIIIMERGYGDNYYHDLGMAYFNVDNKTEALKNIELFMKGNGSNPYLIPDAKFYEAILRSYLDPANAEQHLNNAQSLYTKFRYKSRDMTFALNAARYEQGEKSPELLKSYLENLETPMDPNTPNPAYYTVPIKLARDLGLTDIANTLVKRQQDLNGIKTRARAQNIPGFGTASGNPQRLVTRDTFYLNEYSRLGMKEPADYYQQDLQKVSDLAIARSQQEVIDAADAAAAENERRQYNQEMLAGVATLAGLITTSYANTSSQSAAKAIQTTQAAPVVNTETINAAPAASALATSLSAVAAGSASLGSERATSPTSASANSASKKSPFKPYEIASQCVTRDTRSNSIADFWVNSCSYSVRVMWFEGQDCRTGCMTGVAANGREATNKLAKGDSYRVAACVKPGTPFDPNEDKVWKGTQDFRCLN